MAREKVVLQQDPVEVVYGEERPLILEGLRRRAARLGEALGLPAYVYGSVARGDVGLSSDVDIIILAPVMSFEVEVALDRGGIGHLSREIVKASPNSVPKAHIHIDELTTISFLLGPSTVRGEGFYRFGGLLELAGCDGGENEEGANGGGPLRRVPGVDKRLLLIEPTARGHIESGIMGRKAEVARILGTGVDVVNERVRVLSRRDRVGRTGVYLKHTVADGEGFEEALEAIADRDNMTRRQLRRGRG